MIQFNDCKIPRYEIEANRGYQTLAMLLRKKLPFLNSHILHLCFTMAGTLDVGPLKEPEQVMQSQ